MTVTFNGSDHTRMNTTNHGTYPRRVYLNDNYEADLDNPRSINMASMNARAFLSFLGINSGEDLVGELPIPEVRRAIIKAKATFDSRASRFVRTQEVVHGAPRINDDGTVALRPIRVWVGGIDEEYLWRQLDRLGVLVEVLAAKRATHVRWG
jgi:hypothetical protein